MPFELSVEPTTLAILAVVAFVAGFIDAIAGGGGLLTTPALMTAGLPPHLVLGTNKLCATFGSATASLPITGANCSIPDNGSRRCSGPPRVP